MIAYRHFFLHVFLALLATGFQPLFGQQVIDLHLRAPEPVYRNFNTDQGLPSSETYDVLQDRAGYVWISTDRGVARYDGYRMRVFTKKDGLSDDVVFKLYEDYKGRVWFLTFNGKLSYYEKGKIVPYKYNKLIDRYSKNITALFKSIVIDRDDNLYYAIHYNGLIRISAKGKLTALHDPYETDLHVQRYGGQWIVSCQGVVTREGRKRSYGRVMLKDAAGRWNAEIPWHRLNTSFNMSESGQHAFLLIDSVAFDLNRRKALFSEHPAIGIDCIGNGLFVGLYKHGVRFENLGFPVGHPQRTRFLLSPYSVSAVMRDREGGYWFTTLEKGVFYTPSLSVNVYNYRQGLRDLEAVAITGIRDRIFLSHGMNTTELGRYTRRYKFDHEYRITNYAAATSRKVFLPWDAYQIADPGDPRMVTRCGDIIFAPLFRDAFAKDNYVLLTIYKIWKVYESGRCEELYNYYDAPNHISPQLSFEAVAETDDRRVLLGGEKGLFELRGKSVCRITGDSLFRERTCDLAVHPQLGTIAGTRGYGIYVLDRNLKVGQRIGAQNGLPSDLVTSIYISPGGDVYVGTSKGLVVFSVKNGKLVRKFMLTTAQGLSSNEIRSVYIYGSTAWVAAKNGINIVDLNNRPKTQTGEVYLESITCGSSTYEDCRTPAVLPADIGSIRIALRTENFRGTRQHRFRYRLHDDAEWQASDQPNILLNEPRAGDYRVLVQFLNDRGEWSTPKELLRFTVESPYYATWYFVLGLVLLGTGTLYLLFRARIGQITRRNNLRETINKLEQKALRAQMNPHFIFNSLNSIQSFLIYDENEKAERYLLRFARLIRQTLNNSRESYIPIDVEIETLRSYLELEQMRFKEKFDFALVCELTQTELAHGIPPMLIQPFVENAVLHGFKTLEAGGKIEVRFEKLEDQRLLCVVDDNGIGRKATMSAKPEGHKSFGTKITKERLAAFRQKYGDEFSIETIDKEANGKPAGTRVVLQIPVVTPDEMLLLQEVEG